MQRYKASTVMCAMLRRSTAHMRLSKRECVCLVLHLIESKLLTFTEHCADRKLQHVQQLFADTGPALLLESVAGLKCVVYVSSCHIRKTYVALAPLTITSGTCAVLHDEQNIALLQALVTYLHVLTRSQHSNSALSAMPLLCLCCVFLAACQNGGSVSSSQRRTLHQRYSSMRQTVHEEVRTSGQPCSLCMLLARCCQNILQHNLQ